MLNIGDTRQRDAIDPHLLLFQYCHTVPRINHFPEFLANQPMSREEIIMSVYAESRKLSNIYTRTDNTRCFLWGNPYLAPVNSNRKITLPNTSNISLRMMSPHKTEGT